MKIIEYENLRHSNAAFFDECKEAFSRVLESGWYILGEETKKFEQRFAQACDATHCIGLASGLDALEIALHVAGVGPGDEVIVPSNTYIATILAILYRNATPVLVEPDIHTYTIDIQKIERAITPKTKVILPVHLYGKPCNMEAIQAIARSHGLIVIDDCAQAHLAKYKNTVVGSSADISCFSFYPTKNLGAFGDAGAITTHHEQFAEMIKGLRNYGSIKKYYNEWVGYNSRLDEMQSALLNVKLSYLEDITAHKRMLADIYHQRIDPDLFIKPVVDPDYYDVHHIYPIRHPRRDELKSYLFAHGIKTDIHYPVPPNKQHAMKGILDHIPTPIAQEIHDTILSLPISYGTTPEEVEIVCETLNKFHA